MTYDKQLENLLSLYNNEQIDFKFIKPLNFKCNKIYRINLNKLDIDYLNNYPKYFYKNNKIYAIQLRPIKNNEDKIIIGCGNNPTTDYYHKLFYNGILHSHEGCVTIDWDLSMNPTIVTSFGSNSLDTILSSHRWKEIIMEGIDISYYPYFKSEKKRLLNKSLHKYRMPQTIQTQNIR